MFFFFNQKTAYEMRISDGSSDVCSSDLVYPSSPSQVLVGIRCRQNESESPPPVGFLVFCYLGPCRNGKSNSYPVQNNGRSGVHHVYGSKIGRASCRERVCQYV